LPTIKTTTVRSSQRSSWVTNPSGKPSADAAHHRREKLGRTGKILFSLLLICSGAAGLIYQVLWIKQLSLVVGAEVFSVTIAVSAFFAGLALGGAFFGRRADRIAHPLLLYSVVEAGIAGLGILATVLLAHTAVAFAAIESRAGLVAWAVPFVIVGTPAF
jgi:spermidine synthase